MALYVCHRCMEESGLSPQVGGMAYCVDKGLLHSGQTSHIRTLLGSFVGGLLGLLSGNPVLVLLGAAVGSSIAAASAAASPPADGAQHAVCESCGVVAELERCAKCGEWVCTSCRELVMAEEERQGRRVFRHYELDEGVDEEGSLALAPWYLSDEDEAVPPPGYRLSDEAYSLNEETGELVPIPEGDEGSDSSNLEPADQWDFDSASVSPPTGDWGSSDSWDSSDWDSSSWGDSQDAEGES